MSDLVGGPPGSDRRRRRRVALNCAIYLTEQSVRCTEGRTKDLSSDGFYCIVHDLMPAGKDISYRLVMPAYDGLGHSTWIGLEGQAKVLRVDLHSAGTYGIACRVRDYILDRRV